MTTQSLLEQIYWLLSLVQGGTESIQSIYDLLMTMLDLARSPQSGTLTLDGTEQDMYNTDGGGFPYEFRGGKVDLSNQAAGDTVRIRIYTRLVLGGAWVRESDDAAWTFAGVQDPPGRRIPADITNQFGVRITIQQTVVAAPFNAVHEWFDMKRGS